MKSIKKVNELASDKLMPKSRLIKELDNVFAKSTDYKSVRAYIVKKIESSEGNLVNLPQLRDELAKEVRQLKSIDLFLFQIAED